MQRIDILLKGRLKVTKLDVRYVLINAKEKEKKKGNRNPKEIRKS